MALEMAAVADHDHDHDDADEDETLSLMEEVNGGGKKRRPQQRASSNNSNSNINGANPIRRTSVLFCLAAFVATVFLVSMLRERDAVAVSVSVASPDGQQQQQQQQMDNQMDPLGGDNDDKESPATATASDTEAAAGDQQADPAAAAAAAADGSDNHEADAGGPSIGQRIDALLPKGYKRPAQELSEVYIKRGKPVDDETRQQLAEKWGTWSFVDPKNKAGDNKKNNVRPTDDFYAKYPNRDVPYDKLPDNAWQKDPEYMAAFLPEAKALVERAMDAMLAEYGHGKFDEPHKNFTERAMMFTPFFTEEPVMLNVKHVDDARGGWMPPKSFDGLVRRVLHSVMTEDSFVLAMSGHSLSAGHGNHFQQSYTLQFQRAMEPVFARLGVRCEARNLGYGGLGTLQTGFGAGSLLGPADILVWDSGMTEKDARAMDILNRQSILGMDRVPVIWNPFLKVIKSLEGADIGYWGYGFAGINETTGPEQAETLPYASRYIQCTQDAHTMCREREYVGECWYDSVREDGFDPDNQQAVMGGRAGWHPGCFYHQIRGRALAFPVLLALDKALSLWMEAPDFALPDAAWHVTDYYDNIRDLTRKMPSDEDAAANHAGWCKTFEGIPDRVCTTPLQARSEFTPLYNPEENSIRSIMKDGHGGLLVPEGNIYDPPDQYNPSLDPPDGAFDYYAVVENGNVPYTRLQARKRKLERWLEIYQRKHDEAKLNVTTTIMKPLSDSIRPGAGFYSRTKVAPDNCNGQFDSFCGRDAANTCLMYGHNDNRGGIFMDAYSGWMVLNLSQMKHGIIMLKFHDWHSAKDNLATLDFHCEENGEGKPCPGDDTDPDKAGQRFLPGERRLAPKPYCDSFEFDVALDGKLFKTYNKAEWEELYQRPQRVVQVWTLLDDPDYIKDGAPRDVELAIRTRGCDKTKVFSLTHVYWA